MFRFLVRSRFQRALILLTSVLTVLTYFSIHQYISVPGIMRPATQQHKGQSCPRSTITDNIVVAVKTRATEAADRTPTLAETSFHCAKNVLFFSDLDQHLGGYHMRDALSGLPSSVTKDNPDFDFYWKQY